MPAQARPYEAGPQPASQLLLRALAACGQQIRS
jgi:hypothetical protein